MVAARVRIVRGIVGSAVRVCTLHPPSAKPVAVKLAVKTSGCVGLVRMRDALVRRKKTITSPNLLEFSDQKPNEESMVQIPSAPHFSL